MAVQICSVKRAISLIYQGSAKVIDPESHLAYDFDDWEDVSRQMVEIDPRELISSPSVNIRIPRVIVLLFYDKLPRKQVKFSRKNIFERDGWKCQYCGGKPPKSDLNLDHVIPRSRGGKTTWDNIVASCFTCNGKKGSKTLKQLGWKLKSAPKKPKWHPTISMPLGMVPHKEWVNFLDVAYYNVELENDEDDTERISDI
jgi:5-methylcytosine-specific restriction endonuclease McrA